jgi:hypothetical protein
MLLTRATASTLTLRQHPGPTASTKISAIPGKTWSVVTYGLRVHDRVKPEPGLVFGEAFVDYRQPAKGRPSPFQEAEVPRL